MNYHYTNFQEVKCWTIILLQKNGRRSKILLINKMKLRFLLWIWAKWKRNTKRLKNIFPFIISAFLMLISSIPLSIFLKNDLLYLFSSIVVTGLVYILSLWILNIKELNEGSKMVKWLLQTIISRLKNGNN